MHRSHDRTYERSGLSLLGLVALVGVLGILGLLGWRWQSSRTVQHVVVDGAQHASTDTLRHLAQVDTGTAFGTIDGSLVVDRVERHPWIETARVAKQPLRRTLRIGVTERTPSALAVDEHGRPAFYLTRRGNAMPVPDTAAYDVPLVRGLDGDYHPVRRVAPVRVRGVLSALDGSDARPLVGEIVVQPDSTVRLLTTPVGDHGVIPVRLGPGDPKPKLRQLRAFAEQILATQPDRSIDEIDLRFDDQIIAREHPLDDP